MTYQAVPPLLFEFSSIPNATVFSGFFGSFKEFPVDQLIF